MKNELHTFDQQLDGLIFARPCDGPADSEHQCAKIVSAFEAVEAAWSTVLFSGADDLVLKRYFQFHLQAVLQHPRLPGHGINKSHCPANTDVLLLRGFCDLVNYLHSYCAVYIDFNMAAPPAIQKRHLAAIRPAITELFGSLNDTPVDERLKGLLLDWLNQLNRECEYSTFSLDFLFYLETVVTTLVGILGLSLREDITDELVCTLERIGFNQLDFFYYRQTVLAAGWQSLGDTEKLTAMENSLQSLELLPDNNIRYDNRLPSLRHMLCNWLAEEISACREKIEIALHPLKVDHEKLRLELSVAQLGCLIRLFFAEGIFGQVALTDIFKFTCVHYSTRRRQKISPGSLSKEYYSISQVTAAVIRDLLQKMVQRINRDFFPVWIAVMVISRF